MLQQINKVFFTCNAATDPYTDLTNPDKPLTMFTAAINDSWKGKNGEIAHRATYIDCFALGNLSGVISKNLKKGMLLAVEGRLRSINDKIKVEISSITYFEHNGL